MTDTFGANCRRSREITLRGSSWLEVASVAPRYFPCSKIFAWKRLRNSPIRNIAGPSEPFLILRCRFLGRVISTAAWAGKPREFSTFAAETEIIHKRVHIGRKKPWLVLQIKLDVKIYRWIPSFFPSIFYKMLQRVNIRPTHIRVVQQIIFGVKQSAMFYGPIIALAFKHFSLV